MKNIYVIPFYNTDTCKEVVLKIFSCPDKGAVEYLFKFYINNRCEWKCYFSPTFYSPEEVDFTSWVQEVAGHLSLTGNFSDINAIALFKKICDNLKKDRPHFPEREDSPEETQWTVSRGLPRIDDVDIPLRNHTHINYGDFLQFKTPLQEEYDKLVESVFGAS